MLVIDTTVVITYHKNEHVASSNLSSARVLYVLSELIEDVAKLAHNRVVTHRFDKAAELQSDLLKIIASRTNKDAGNGH